MIAVALLAFLTFDNPAFGAEPDTQVVVQDYLNRQLENCKKLGPDCPLTKGYDYTLTKNYTYLVLLPLLLIGYTLSGLAKKTAQFVQRRFRKPFIHALINALPVFLIIKAHYWVGEIINERYWCGGLKVRGDDGFWRCPPLELWQIQNGVANFLIGLFSLAAGFWFLRQLLAKHPSKSWVLAALIFCGWTTYASLGSDRFYKDGYKLPEGSTTSRIYEMADSIGFPKGNIQIGRVKLFGSDELGQVNGFGQNQVINIGISLWPSDNRDDIPGSFNMRPSNKIVTHEQTIAVAGHELAHVKEWHLEKALILISLIIFLISWLSFFSVCRLLKIKVKGLRAIRQWHALPLITGVFLTGLMLYGPATNPFRLLQEYEADRIGLDIAKEPDGMAEFLINSGGGFYRFPIWEQWLFVTHPNGEERIKIAMEWKAKNKK
jgi:hypothetical protein